MSSAARKDSIEPLKKPPFEGGLNCANNALRTSDIRAMTPFNFLTF